MTDWYSPEGRHYIVGRLVIRFDDGADRITLEHCGKDMTVFYPNMDYPELPYKAVCSECRKPYHAKRAGDLWVMTQI